LPPYFSSLRVIIMQCTAFFVLALFYGAPLVADEPTRAAENRAKAIVPFCDERTGAVVRVDLQKLDRDKVVDTIAKFTSQERAAVARDMGGFRRALEAFKAAGGKELFVVFSLADMPHPGLLVVPLYPGADADALQRTGQQLGMGGEIVRLHNALVTGDPGTLARVKNLKAKPSPALSKAFAAAGDTTAQVVLLPGALDPQVTEQMAASLPGELGQLTKSVLTSGIPWIAVGAELTPQARLHLVIQAPDARAADGLSKSAALQLERLADGNLLRPLNPNFHLLIPGLTPRVEGDRLVLDVDEPTLVAVLVPVFGKMRAGAGQAQAANHLRHIAVAMHNYHATYNAFPPHASYDANGKALLSWRVHLLPYLEQQQLYQQFHLNEPWDSDHNRKLISKMPELYGDPGSPLSREGKAVFVVPVGKETIFQGGAKGTPMVDIPDGTSNTILVLEVPAERAVTWTKPEDLNVSAQDPLPGLLGRGRPSIPVAFADGSLRVVLPVVSPRSVWAMLTRNGGEVLPDVQAPPRAGQPMWKKPMEPVPAKSNDVWSVAISPDGKYAAAGAGWWDQPGEVGIWDLAARKQLRLLRADLGVASVAFSPNSKILAFAGWAGHVRLCDPATGVDINDLEIPGVARIAFSPDGTLLAAANEGNTVRLWQVPGGKHVADLDGDLFRFHCIAFSPDGKRVLAGGGDWKAGGICQVNVWDVASKKQVIALRSPDRAILAVAVSPDSKTIASGGLGNSIHLWNAETGEETKTLRGHTRWIHALAFMPDGATLVSGAEDGIIRLWDVAQGREKGQVAQPLRAPPPAPGGNPAADGGRPWNNIRSLCVSPDGATLLVGGNPTALRFYELANSRETTLSWNKDAPAPDSHGSRLWILVALVAVALGLSGWFLVRRFWSRDAARSESTEPPLETAELADDPPRPVIVACSSCGKKLKIPPELVGKKIKCRGCGQLVR
jgi:WD40 repeat protein